MFTPGAGKNCRAASSNHTPENGAILHYHLDSKGYLRVFIGTAEACPDYRAYARGKMKELIAEERAEPHPDEQ